jgi:hypothetical protein
LAHQLLALEIERRQIVLAERVICPFAGRRPLAELKLAQQWTVLE